MDHSPLKNAHRTDGIFLSSFCVLKIYHDASRACTSAFNGTHSGRCEARTEGNVDAFTTNTVAHSLVVVLLTHTRVCLHSYHRPLSEEGREHFGSLTRPQLVCSCHVYTTHWPMCTEGEKLSSEGQLF
jgi:hypothetical protein